MEDSFWSSTEGGHRHGQLPPKSIYYDPVDIEQAGGGKTRGIAVDEALFFGAKRGLGVGSGAEGRGGGGGGRVEQVAAVGYVGFMITYLGFAVTRANHVASVDTRQVLAMAVVVVALSASLVFGMMRAVRPIIYATCIVTPLALLSVSGVSLQVSWYSGEWQWAVVGAVTLVAGLWMMAKMASKGARENVESVVQICGAASESLWLGKDVFLVPSLMVILFYSLLLVTLKCDLPVWIRVIAVLWSFGVFECTVKSVTAMIVTDAYYRESGASAFSKLHQILTNSRQFGRVCLMGIISLLIRLLSIVTISYRLLVTHTVNIPVLKTVLLSISAWMTIVERWSLKFSDHCMYTAITTDTSLWHSCRHTVTLFRRNLITVLLTDSAVSASLFTITFLSIALFALTSRNAVSLPTTLLMYAIIKLHMDIITSCIDSSLVCYAVDLDGNEMRKPRLHQAFSNRVNVIRHDLTL